MYTVKNDVIQLLNSEQLFLAQLESAQRQFSHFIGERTLTTKMLDNFRNNILLNSEFCRNNNIVYKHIVFPAKIPSFKKLFAEHGLIVKPMFSESHSLENVCYPEEVLDPEVDFYKTDTHNSDTGKLKLVNFLLAELNQRPLSDEALFEKRQFKGDLAQMLGLETSLEDKFIGFKNRNLESFLFGTGTALSGNMGRIIFNYNKGAKYRFRILLFGDSFIQGLIPILNYYYEEIIYFRSPYVIQDIAKNLTPDIIITSNAERYLTSVPDASLCQPYFLHFFSNRFEPSKFSESDINALNAVFSGRESPLYKRFIRSLVNA